jgi:prepilin-type N-terminal cleavage/methylation domain-containing protein
MRNARYNSGFTLIEILLSLAILGIVLAAGYSIYSLGATTNQRAGVQSELQHDTLKVSEFITQALHGATEVKILSSASDVPATVSDDYNYIYLYQASGTTVYSVIFKNKNGTTLLVNQYANANTFTLDFESQNSGKVCYYKIDGISGTQTYTMDSSVKLPNATISSILTQGPALQFKINSSSNITIPGTSVDDTVGLNGTGNKSVYSGDNSWEIVMSYVTLKSSISASDITITGMPSGLSYSVQYVNGSTLKVTVSGTASSAISGVQNLSMVIKPSAVTNTNALASGPISVRLVPYTTIAATVSDATIGLAADKIAIDPSNNSWVISLSNATLSTGFGSGNIKVSGLPAGLSYTAAGTSGGNTINIVVSGAATTAISTTTSVSLTVLASAVNGSYIIDSDVISVTLVPPAASDFDNYVLNQNVFVYGNDLTFSGNKVDGPNATMVIKGNLTATDFNGGSYINVSNIYIDGNFQFQGNGLGSSTNPGYIYVDGDLDLWNGGTYGVYGDVYVAGNLRLKDAHIHGDIYVGCNNVGGNVELGCTPALDSGSNIYYTGTLTKPNNYDTTITSKCIKKSTVASFVMPAYPIPSLKSDAWYAEQKYVSGGSLVSGIKIFTNSYSFSNSATYINVVIVSKGDINLSGGNLKLTGVLFAPNGKVTFDGSSFEGVVIAKNGFLVTSGGSTVTFKNISNYIPNISNYPF